MDLPILLTLSFTTFFIVYLFFLLYKRPLSHIPGPLLSNFTNLRLKLANIQGQRMHYIHTLHKKYGTTVRISPTEVSTIDAAAFTTIHQGRAAFDKAQWYMDLGGPGAIPGVFNMLDAHRHAARRKLLARGFAKSTITQDWEPAVSKLCGSAVSKIAADLSGPEHVSDVRLWLNLMATDIGSRVMFGESLDALRLGRPAEYSELVDQCMMLYGLQAEVPPVRWLAPLLAPVVPFFRLSARLGPAMMEYGALAVRNARAANPTAATSSIFARMFAGNDNGDAGLSDEDIAAEARNLSIASSDTTAMTLLTLLYEVLRRPALREALEAELNALPEDSLIDAKLEELPLLNACLLESLRLGGGASASLRREVPAPGVTLGGFDLPAGSVVSTQAWSLHRDTSAWGADAAAFKYERWFDEKGVLQRDGPPGAVFCPFGAGPRGCLGLHLAWMEMRLFCAFFFRICKGVRISEKTKDEDMQLLDYFTIRSTADSIWIAAGEGTSEKGVLST